MNVETSIDEDENGHGSRDGLQGVEQEDPTQGPQGKSKSCCFTIVMLLCLCDAVLPLSSYFACVMLLCLWHAAFLSLYCYTATVMSLCYCLAGLPFIFLATVHVILFASVMLFCLSHATFPLTCCFDGIFVLAIVGWLCSILLVCPVILHHCYPYPYHGLGANISPL